MKILITGANGLLGQKIVESAVQRPHINLVATSMGENRNRVTEGYRYESLDITSRESVISLIRQEKPDVIINTAAMTNVDECEKEKEKCRKANVDAVAYLAEAAKTTDSHLIHLSTDFVFDGQNGPYSEEDQPNPLSYYGSSKFEAEQIVQNSGLHKWAIARTIIVYGLGHRLSRGNIVLWAKQMMEDGKEIKIVDDQFRSPTFAEDLAEGCLLIALKGTSGIFHLSGPETFSIYEIVRHIAEFYGLDFSLVKPVKTGEFVQPAVRPLRTGFNINKAVTQLGFAPHKLKDALELMTVQLRESSSVT